MIVIASNTFTLGLKLECSSTRQYLTLVYRDHRQHSGRFGTCARPRDRKSTSRYRDQRSALVSVLIPFYGSISCIRNGDEAYWALDSEDTGVSVSGLTSYYELTTAK